MANPKVRVSFIWLQSRRSIEHNSPHIGSCNIAEPTNTQALFLFDSECLKLASLTLNASCVVSRDSCSLMFKFDDGLAWRETPSSCAIIHEIMKRTACFRYVNITR